MSHESFLIAFKATKCQEDLSDVFSAAQIKRRILALNYYGSFLVNERLATTEFLLNENLDQYAEVVDNKDFGKVNNYADYVLSILSNFQNDEKQKWKSHLDSYNLKHLFEPLSCSNMHNCSNLYLEISLKLKHAFLQYKKENKLEELEVAKLHSDGHVELFKTDVAVKNTVTLTKNVQPNENISKNKSTLFFQTAKDEMLFQSARRCGKNGNQNKRHWQDQIKKTLGGRKCGVYGKFQPPLRSQENTETELNKMDIDEVVDERLKNIDPGMIELIKNEIMDSVSKITWDDIAGLQLAKSTIQEIVVWPMLRPDIFTGLRRPPKGILLFGPPGTGKTLIGKCIASQSNSTFFSISASSLTSKWVGDGEKMVRTLFAVAKVYQPSVVFIDEIDSLLTQRSDSDHECSRRIKTEFLVQLDGAGTGDEDRILIIGATNRPQELDEAARRRLVKRLYIPLPDEEARKKIIQNLISTERHNLTEAEIQNIAKITKGFSGADVKNLCQEASLGPIRSIGPSMIQSINPTEVRPLSAKDFESALCRIKSSVSEKDVDVYLAWDKQYGCGSGLG